MRNHTTPAGLFLTGLLLTGCTAPAVAPSVDQIIVTSSSSSHSETSSRAAVQSSSSPASAPKTPSDSIAPLAVPFTSQAPFANWDDPYQEACEEAAILMVVHYLNGTALNPSIADKDILDLVDWETQNGYGYDITAAQMVEVAEKKFGLNARVRTDVSEASIVEELAAGNPVIIPAAGRMLQNPYFSGEGPWYHALVITGFKKGWNANYFVTNDPGTKRGAGYEYRTDILLDAIHDWTGVKEDTAQGKPAMVIIER